MALRTDLTVTFDQDRLEEMIRYAMTFAILEFDGFEGKDMWFDSVGQLSTEANDETWIIDGSYTHLVDDGNATYAVITISARTEKIDILQAVVNVRNRKDMKVVGVYDYDEFPFKLIEAPES